MKSLIAVGLVLIVLGAVGIVIRSVEVTTDRDTVVDVPGVIKVEAADRERTLLPLYLGIGGVAVGLVFVALGVLRPAGGAKGPPA